MTGGCLVGPPLESRLLLRLLVLVAVWLVVFFILAAFACCAANLPETAALGVTVLPELVIVWLVLLLLMVICSSDLVFEVVVEADVDEYGIVAVTVVRDWATELDDCVGGLTFRLAALCIDERADWFCMVGVEVYWSDCLFWVLISCYMKKMLKTGHATSSTYQQGGGEWGSFHPKHTWICICRSFSKRALFLRISFLSNSFCRYSKTCNFACVWFHFFSSCCFVNRLLLLDFSTALYDEI